MTYQTPRRGRVVGFDVLPFYVVLSISVGGEVTAKILASKP
ncbi:hypothetical protein CCP3SC1AL1_280008 [Gammaproteobacteria bacterium]